MQHYTQACLVFSDVSEDAFSWLEQVHAALQRVIYDHWPSDEDRELYALVVDRWWAGFAPDTLGFTIERDGTSAILAGEEHANHLLMACLAQAYLQRYGAEGDRALIEYAYTSDEPTRGGYGGGAWIVSQKDILNTDSRKWAKELRCS